MWMMAAVVPTMMSVRAECVVLCCEETPCSIKVFAVDICLMSVQIKLPSSNPSRSQHCVNMVTHFFCFSLPTVQFDGAEWDRSSSPTERLRSPGPRTSPLAGGGKKFRMPQEGLTMVGERVDPGVPLEKQVYV